jgi:hypothetical protein
MKMIRSIVNQFAIAEAKIDGKVTDLRRYWKSNSLYSGLKAGYRLQFKIVIEVSKKKYPMHLVLDRVKDMTTKYWCLMGKDTVMS